MKFEEWLAQQDGVIEVECGCVTTEAFYHWMRVAYEAGNSPVVPDDVSIFEAAIEECKTCDSIDEHAWNHGVLAVIAKYESCHAAMLAAAPQSPGSEPATAPGKWIPVSDRMPENDVPVLTFDGMYKRVHHAMYGHWQCWEPEKITHWMPLPAAPQGVGDA